MSDANGAGLEERLEGIKRELEGNYPPAVIGYAVRFVGALIEHLGEQKEMSAETREEVMYCIHKLLSWTADYQEQKK